MRFTSGQGLASKAWGASIYANVAHPYRRHLLIERDRELCRYVPFAQGFKVRAAKQKHLMRLGRYIKRTATGK